MNKIFFCCLLVTALVVLGILIVGCTEENAVKEKESREPTVQLEPMSELRNVIEVRVEGEILHYQKESFWNEEDFCQILGLKKKFEFKEIDSFRKHFERYNRHIVNSKVELDEAIKSTTLTCDVKGAKEGYWYDFDWFLRPLGLDFIDNHFERREKELYWEGEINGIRTTININSPFRISNCHEHVWPVE